MPEKMKYQLHYFYLMISINYECTIKIYSLKHFRLLKQLKHKESNLHPAYSIGADSKMLAALTMDGDIIVYDFTEKLRRKYLKYL